ncbi:hypothetical protein [Mesorhizobium sp. Z1-4]|uniref:hypothetical protein n=1 Tax=Mesorhizobium sp. Z1-4 TaxID=2448478 RepID=UPI000FDA10CF|nr:hypothetical protein [Mesorhizobium sp. Z1-4]
MSKVSRRTSWFESLRREGGLFAALAVLLTVLNALQPLGAAQAAGQDFVICTLAGAAGDEGEPRGMPEGCPACIGVHHCTGAAAFKAALASEPAFAPPAAVAEARLSAEFGLIPPGTAAGPPPAIRAPPFIV